MKDLLIAGASGFGREVAWLVERINSKKLTWNILGFLDSDTQKWGQSINGYPVLGGDEEIHQYPTAYVVCAVANARVREKIICDIQRIAPEVKFATLIDPSVEMSEWISVGEGTIVCAHTIATVNIEIGSHVIINLDCTVGHDAIISDFVTVYPSVNISGNTVLGRCCEIGTGAQIIQGKRIGDYSILGAGAVVIKDIPCNCTAVGSPAKPIKFFT